MSQRLKAYGVSFLLHALFLTGFVWLSQTNLYKNTKPLEIDLSLLEFRKEESIQELKTVQPKTETKSKIEAFKAPKTTQKMSTPQEIPQKATSGQRSEATEPQAKKTMPVEETMEKPKTLHEQSSTSTMSQGEKSQAVASEPAGTRGSKEAGAQTSASQEGTGRASKTLETSHTSSEEEQKQLYLKEKLSVISQIIQKNISYPPIARRMGWEGRVVLSMRLCTDGTVKEIKILESSGYEVLDRNAVDTVRRVAGLFPKPPVEVVVKVPVKYKLE